MIRAIPAAVLALACVAGPPASADVVLLNNGSFLEGEVDHLPDTLVVRGEGSVIRLRASDTAHVAGSRVEAYEWMRARAIDRGMALSDHLRLADWCLQNGLPSQAARELLDARQVEPHSRRLALLERRLDESLRAAEPAPPAELKRDESVAQAVALEPVEAAAPQLPSEALEHFTRRIQPMLLNGCAASRCHGGDDPQGGFALDRSPLHGYGDSRSTERNLVAALAAIDYDHPRSSPLVTTSRGPHAGVSPFAGPRRDEVIRQIESWVLYVASTTEAPPARDEQQHNGVELAVAASPAAQAPEDPMVVQATFDAEPSAPVRGAQLKRVDPRDEFDPAVFNSRFLRPEDGPSTGAATR